MCSHLKYLYHSQPSLIHFSSTLSGQVTVRYKVSGANSAAPWQKPATNEPNGTVQVLRALPRPEEHPPLIASRNQVIPEIKTRVMPALPGWTQEHTDHWTALRAASGFLSPLSQCHSDAHTLTPVDQYDCYPLLSRLGRQVGGLPFTGDQTVQIVSTIGPSSGQAWWAKASENRPEMKHHPTELKRNKFEVERVVESKIDPRTVWITHL